MSGIRRKLGARTNPKNALTVDELKAMLRKLPHTMLGIRDKAILLIGFAGASRRSELEALDVEDIAIVGAGLRLMSDGAADERW